MRRAAVLLSTLQDVQPVNLHADRICRVFVCRHRPPAARDAASITGELRGDGGLCACAWHRGGGGLSAAGGLARSDRHQRPVAQLKAPQVRQFRSDGWQQGHMLLEDPVILARAGR